MNHPNHHISSEEKEHSFAGRDTPKMSQMNHADHESAMTNPSMAKEMGADMWRRFFISLFSPIPKNLLLFLLTTPIVFWTGSIFITGTYYSLKARKLNMAVLIATGVLAAYFGSVALALIGGGEVFYEAAAMLVTFVLFGHWMEMKSRRGTSDSLRALFDLVPPQARVMRQEGGVVKEMLIASSEVVVGDVVILKPGDKVPVDGEVTEGETAIDEALVTGESLPVSKKIGDTVVGGSINQSGAIRFRATKVGADTVLASIIKMVETAQNSKAPGQRIADKAAAYLVVLAVGSGIAAFFGWYAIAGATFTAALTFAIATVVIAIGAGTDVVVETASIVLMKSAPYDIVATNAVLLRRVEPKLKI